MADKALNHTALSALHSEQGARLVAFAGYEMPVQFSGVVDEHRHTREQAGLFDVSHMGQALLKPLGSDPAAALESLAPGALAVLKPGRMRYTVLLNDRGGILDDLMVTRVPGGGEEGPIHIVVNAARKDADFELIESRLGDQVEFQRLDDRSLVALQGPAAVDVLIAQLPQSGDLSFMQAMHTDWNGSEIWITRSGYTGEDGFEISIESRRAEAFARKLLDDDRVKPVGLGARDSLRLEAGLCLYGHDLDETTSPVEANITFAIGKNRRDAGDFPGGERIRTELSEGPSRLRVGLRPEGRAIAREGADIFSVQGQKIGTVTSGGFGPTVGGPIAMGYVQSDHAGAGTEVLLEIRGKRHPAQVRELPFVEHRYVRK